MHSISAFMALDCGNASATCCSIRFLFRRACSVSRSACSNRCLSCQLPLPPGEARPRRRPALRAPARGPDQSKHGLAAVSAGVASSRSRSTSAGCSARAHRLRRETLGIELVDAARKSDIACDANEREVPPMPRENHAKATIAATVTVTAHGEVGRATPRGSYRQGFADLLDFTSPPARCWSGPVCSRTRIRVIRCCQVKSDGNTEPRNS